MKKFFASVWKYLKADGPQYIKQALMALIPFLIKLGITSLAKAPKKEEPSG